MESLIGTRLGPYEIVAAIGAGGMGEVYRAHDTRLGREVAIKVLPGALAADPDALARFEREARAVAAINHPNILALHDIGTHNGIAHAVMELLEGETLRARLENGPPPPRKALEWAVQIANGLAAAHDRGIVHRDLKPENVFLTRDGRVKILDFGIARRDRADAEIGSNVTTLSERGLFVGTPAYASPEQVVGEPATPRSDLFSFGVLLYELLTGANPFLRDTVADTMTAVLRVDPPSLTATVPGAPAAALRIVERCLEKQPSERPSSAHDLALFLDASGGTIHEPALAVPPDEARAAARRLQLKVLIASGGLLLAVVAATWAHVAINAGRAVDAALGRQLEHDQRLVGRVHGARLDRLQFTARLVASFPALKSLFDTQDPATVRDFLLSYRQQNPGTPLLVAIEPSGVVLGSTETPESGGVAAAGGWRDAAFAGKGQPRVVAIGGRPYHTASAAAAAGGNVFGYVVAAEPVDGEFARTIAESTGDEAVVLSSSAVLGSTLTGGATPWTSIEDWRQQGGRSDSTAMIVIGATRFAAREVVLTPDPAVSAVLARSRDDALEPYRQIQTGLVLIGLGGVVAALLSSLWLYRTSRVSVPAR